MLYVIAILIILLTLKLMHPTTRFLLFSIIFCASFIILLIIYAKDAVSSCRLGINLWFNIVFPSIFPFLVVCDILNYSKVTIILGKFFEPLMRPLFNVPGLSAPLFILGLLSGYPIGATTTLSLYNQDLITKHEAERLITFTNNSGPIFIISAIGCGFLGNKKIGILLYICHVLAAISVGFIFSFYKKSHSCHIKKSYLSSSSKPTYTHQNSIRTFTNAVVSSIYTMINIAGFIIFFSVAIKMLTNIGFFKMATTFCAPLISWLNLEPNIISACLSGLLEMTYGISQISQLHCTLLSTKALVTSFLLGVAGISIHFQIFSILAKSDIKITPFIIGKLLQGTFSTIYFALINLYFVY